MNDLNKEIQFVKGIGPKRAEKLHKLNIFTLKDLIYYFPRQYEDRSKVKKINQLENEEKVTIKGVITRMDSYSPKKGMNIIRMDMRDDTGYIKLSFFNQEYIKRAFKSGDSIVVFGKVKIENNFKEFVPIEIEHYSSKPQSNCKIEPVYPLTYGLSNKELQGIIRSVLTKEEFKVKEYLPTYILEKYKLCGIDFAVRNIHSPSNKEALKIALYRLVFEEFLILQLGLFYFKNGVNESSGIEFKENEKLNDIIESLPFKLTKAQNRALSEITQDMTSSKVMNRLVQGDVGSGKTVVALLALASAVLNGYQGALMAPTEILASQHYDSFKEILERFNIKSELLVGSLTKKQKEKVLEKVKNQEVDILIGTHALIEDKVEFKNLGIVITDEQHRFGVRQRGRLSNKGDSPDILVMTATPIPRTLALILYGDLDISIIDELPPGRQPIETIAIEHKRRNEAYENLVRSEVQKGRQVYVVCPLVEESEKIEATAASELVEELKREFFSDLRVGLLHGKMRPAEKDAIMDDFKNKKLDILVSTTVIEVGVNVPNATLMIIENAERFGLAQLHQLRGRVGRGNHKSYCILIYNSKTEVCKERMAIMEETTDGFKISQKDLEIRGPGEFFGTRQHGLPELKVANIFKHIKILKQAQLEARYIIGQDRRLQLKENQKIKEEILYKFSEREEISLN
ncbi:MAG: ATP-dependent DNA helicase RecG [Clostridiales bacterium]|uniref:ATP-dependent DNA helicase RecG n=1 Tax=Terrisporobacter sp. TaxID=1965305 RepID=UPI002A50FEA2|nr:ATP-dependent DNA helicase RecG [Terrisporobacter sp.]MDD7755012.1 ATP-dependent DNA helicase RecG [Clostridiales bacterium]MDY4133827.1 ATP-dependent DNA helicase RecG [Terrisporobacter sp.]